MRLNPSLMLIQSKSSSGVPTDVGSQAWLHRNLLHLTFLCMKWECRWIDFRIVMTIYSLSVEQVSVLPAFHSLFIFITSCAFQFALVLCSSAPLCMCTDTWILMCMQVRGQPQMSPLRSCHLFFLPLSLSLLHTVVVLLCCFETRSFTGLELNISPWVLSPLLQKWHYKHAPPRLAVFVVTGVEEF